MFAKQRNTNEGRETEVAYICLVYSPNGHSSFGLGRLQLAPSSWSPRLVVGAKMLKTVTVSWCWVGSRAAGMGTVPPVWEINITGDSTLVSQHWPTDCFIRFTLIPKLYFTSSACLLCCLILDCGKICTFSKPHHLGCSVNVT